jgi:hypothetical protein
LPGAQQAVIPSCLFCAGAFGSEAAASPAPLPVAVAIAKIKDTFFILCLQKSCIVFFCFLSGKRSYKTSLIV